jgi:asparagine N-glycosylation enzyme membrane subunit Stt3
MEEEKQEKEKAEKSKESEEESGDWIVWGEKPMAEERMEKASEEGKKAEGERERVVEKTKEKIKGGEKEKEGREERKREEKKGEERKREESGAKGKKGLKIEKFFPYFTVAILLAIVALSIYLRTQNIPQLKDVTTGHYTLGPDLDPFLYLRHAREIVNGTLREPDMMRAAPLGSDNYAKTNLMPWAIVLIYKVLDVFFSYPIASVEYAAIIAPVIFFSLTLIVFFLFVRQLFLFFTSKNKATLAALIATAFYAVMPEMLHRTTAGIPEIESLGMLWFWLAFLFFTLAWQSFKIKQQAIFGILSGIFTGLMIWTWGGFRYIFMTMALASFLVFFFEKEKRKNLIIFASWLIPGLIFSIAKIGIKTTLLSLTDTGFALAVFVVIAIDYFTLKVKPREKIRQKTRLPDSLLSLIVIAFVGILALLAFNPDFLASIFSKIIEGLLYPFGRGRIGLTVAENRAPYFVEVFASFSWLFWLFFFGTIALFYEATKHFDKRPKFFLNTFFIIFLLTFIFSRISPTSMLNGENFISKFLYFGGLIVFAIVLLAIYIKAYRQEDDKTIEDFKAIAFSYFLLLAFSFWMIVSMRGAVRLFFIISPAIILNSVFLFVKAIDYTKVRDELARLGSWLLLCLIIVAFIFNFVTFTKATATEAKWTIPGPYYQQWQKAMAWVRNNTPKDAIFAHWWDYGYWLQTIGERPTILDGGHAMHGGFWNYLMGRHVLTAPNEIEALEFLYAHNASYLLIDSTDIGKYPAYSSIGCDASGKDRVSWISTFVLDERQTQELRNETKYVYVGGTLVDEDIVWNNVLLPQQKAGVAAFIMTVEKGKIKSIEAIFVYRNQQIKAPIRYVYINNQLLEVGNESAINATLYIIPRLTNQGINNIGAALYLSPRLMRSLMVRLYLLNQSEHFELVHKEDALFIQQLRDAYNISIGDFLLANDLLGPIKIWKINYPENFSVEEAKLKRYLSFKSDLPFALW